MKFILSIFIFLFGYNAFAQSLPSSVIGTSGESFMAVNGSLEWTMGEIMIQTDTIWHVFLNSKN